MAVWADPLDELIAGLERTLPAETLNETVPYEVFCTAVDVLLYGTAEEWEQYNRGSDGQRVATNFARISRHRATPGTD